MKGLFLVLALCLEYANAFYLPGVAPTPYKAGDKVPLLVNHITPSINQEDSSSKTYLYSYDYYFPRFHFCKPADGPEKQSESLGSVIFGDRIFSSPFELNMLENKTCQNLCSETYSKSDAVFVNRNIRAGFKHNWLIDGLPAARQMLDEQTDTTFYNSGFHIGYVDDENVAHLYNHYDIYIEYHKRKEDEYRVVGVIVDPKSLTQTADVTCDPETSVPVTLSQEADTGVTFTYSVYFIESPTVWATRWDKYLHVYDPKIQWFSLVNFSLIVIFLSIIMSHILIRTLRNDIQKYNEINLDDDMIDEMGWKLVYGDVFRPPKNPMLLSVLVGSGVQFLLMAVSTCGFALLGLLSPSNRGSLATLMFVLYAVFGSVGSFTSAYIYKFFQGEDWKTNMILSPLLVPGALFGLFIFFNFFLIFAHSSGAVPIGTMFVIVLIWFAISVPLSCFGSLLGFRRPAIKVPVKVNQIPRQIPKQAWYLKTSNMALIAGIFPFGAIAIEMYFIYNSLWFNRIYYMFGFLFFCFILMLITTLLVTLLLIYYTLCNENYKWQWRSFFVGGGISVYVFLHALILSKFRLGGFTSVILYVGYSLVISLGIGLLCGAVGFIGVMVFVLSIYSQIKVD
ncbi:hypothetical protein KL907_001394 [Ogataea polymorpha]|uniref:Transmembrane 9 superfamily member n=1 Tax=Ogataea polymorpha TaxID=460523 RepID=A0A9P8TBW3_9ASCO|nr:hypothetical protein KL937_001362 [Ogataea polymorpha]KAG7890884.1 hypothetical protein KL936_002168 [Ogataea polymorpha]KAG7910503.1 hypothetical protein KL907_001394 [Ogataea polymorpha]KAG7911020.1 hypothetical protein KL906_001400 [Ogataea polymorpha]KAG7938829.1 hypothetical protein KL904_001358 [Ogataea polymorpha]